MQLEKLLVRVSYPLSNHPHLVVHLLITLSPNPKENAERESAETYQFSRKQQMNLILVAVLRPD